MWIWALRVAFIWVLAVLLAPALTPIITRLVKAFMGVE